tara:strand:- start:327 stop:686 length:360 start_codon:yes stop_codon:yes gene_type:complete
MITVLYDGKCGLCSREIGHYMKICPKNVFVWQDIANEPEHLIKLKITQSDALRRLHVIDDYGTVFIGVDAFLTIWAKIPRWKFLALFVSIPGIKQVVSKIYNVFADWKFDRSPHCKLAG